MSNLTGAELNLDVYQMIGTYYQTEVKVFDKSCADEKACGVPTQKAYRAKLQKRLKTLKSAYKGKNERLYRNYGFFAVKYQRSSNRTARFITTASPFMRNVWQDWFTRYVKSSILRPPTD